jgi:hypothetical protein
VFLFTHKRNSLQRFGPPDKSAACLTTIPANSLHLDRFDLLNEALQSGTHRQGIWQIREVDIGKLINYIGFNDQAFKTEHRSRFIIGAQDYASL